MKQPAIKVEGLWKEYSLGTIQKSHGTFYDLLAHSINAPFSRLSKLGGKNDISERFWALRDINFEVRPGEVLGVIGHNGAGKSTLLKILSRITAPTRGTISVRGRLASLLEVGTGFHGELSGRENIYLNGAILGMSRSEVARKFDDIVAFSEIEKFIDTPVKRYSSGMYVRLAFGVAAHLEPEILIVDEVLAVGDAAFQRKCLEKMQNVANTGKAIIFVSHNIGAISQLCNRAILLEHGKCLKDTTVTEAISKYLSTNIQKKSVVNYKIDSNKVVQITHASFQDRNNIEISSCLHNESFFLFFNYCVRDWPIGAYICIDIFNESNQRLIWSSDANSAEAMTFKRSSGKYQATITIPANVLSTGRYDVTLAIYSPRRNEIYDLLDKQISIVVVDGGSILSTTGIQNHALTSVPLVWNVNQTIT